uniref:Uncharacterized protein n=1 Tax=Rhizophora mucronata TaxID=61149 RepID=A0A2P2NMH6_RHIMU
MLCVHHAQAHTSHKSQLCHLRLKCRQLNQFSPNESEVAFQFLFFPSQLTQIESWPG